MGDGGVQAKARAFRWWGWQLGIGSRTHRALRPHLQLVLVTPNTGLPRAERLRAPEGASQLRHSSRSSYPQALQVHTLPFQSNELIGAVQVRE